MNIRLLNFGLILTGAMLLFSCTSDDNSDNSNEDTEKRAKPVRVSQLEKRSVDRSINYTANLQAFDEVFLVPASPGKIERIHVDVGDRVQAGQLLFEMDPTQLNQAILQLNNIEKDMQRFDSLIEFGGIPRQQYDQMQTQYEITKENVEFLKTNTRVTAPFSGVITAKFFENGELYAGAPNTQVGKAAVVILQRINPIKAVIAVSERYFPEVNKNMTVNLKSEIYPGKEFEGKISRIHPTINPASKTFNVEVRVPNPEELLRPGMFARLSLDFGQEPAIVVPANVVLQQIGTNERFVFLRVNGKAQRVTVNIGQRFDDYLEIISDKLSVGDEIVVSGHNNLLNGDLIEIMN